MWYSCVLVCRSPLPLSPTLSFIILPFERNKRFKSQNPSQLRPGRQHGQASSNMKIKLGQCQDVWLGTGAKLQKQFPHIEKSLKGYVGKKRLYLVTEIQIYRRARVRPPVRGNT